MRITDEMIRASTVKLTWRQRFRLWMFDRKLRAAIKKIERGLWGDK